MSTAALRSPSPSPHINIGQCSPRPYDYLLKFLLVGDSDVGKEELLNGMGDGASESPYGFSSCGKIFKQIISSFMIHLSLSMVLIE